MLGADPKGVTSISLGSCATLGYTLEILSALIVGLGRDPFLAYVFEALGPLGVTLFLL